MTSETNPALLTATTVAALGSGVVGGVFFAFSTFVMAALDQLPADRAIRAMQAINRTAPTAGFMTALFGTALVCVGVGGVAATRLDQPAARWQLAGSVLYLAGVVLTAGYHVPRNDALALVDPAKVDAVRTWARYSGPWTAWNHVRTATSIGAAVAFTIGLRSA